MIDRSPEYHHERQDATQLITVQVLSTGFGSVLPAVSNELIHLATSFGFLLISAVAGWVALAKLYSGFHRTLAERAFGEFDYPALNDPRWDSPPVTDGGENA